MAVRTFRHGARLSPSGRRLLDRHLALLCNPALEERILAWRMSGRGISLYDRFASLTALRKQDPEWQEISGLVVRLERAMPGVPFAGEVGQGTGIPMYSGPEPVPLVPCR